MLITARSSSRTPARERRGRGLAWRPSGVAGLLLGCALAACTSAAPPPPHLIGPPTAAPPPPQPPPDPCAGVQRHNAALRQRLDARLPDPDNPFEDQTLPLARRLAADLDRCFPDPRGAWAIQLDDPRLGGVVELPWRLLRLDPSGHPLASFTPEEPTLEVCCDPTEHTDDLRAADLNGDGTPELIASWSWSGPEGGSARTLTLLTLQGDRVVPLLPEPEDADLEDRDGDGRLDLVLHHRADTRLSCMDYAWEPLRAPDLVARGLPDGRFDLLASADLNRAACPPLPDDLLTTRRVGKLVVFDEPALAANLLCAAALGARTPDDLLRLLDASCVEPPFAESCEDMPPRPRECRHQAALRGWLLRLQRFTAPTAR